MEKQDPIQDPELSVPINKLWDKMLMLSIVGILDSMRTQVVMEDMLNRIRDVEAKVIVLDIQGVAVVDSAVANHLMKITKATRLMGCSCIISGISPAVSQTIVNLGIELENTLTTSTLKEALEFAFDKLGYSVIQKG
ncbi:MAG: STAS domain-containing protein [Deltaproteobacteria bacterium]|nr:MAG: STAS domain-containing protein [Deltaproteobacteria bacterium]RLB95506.1 MAG: STAS domain-containing protein [Deltaproteobacteria bacterium]